MKLYRCTRLVLLAGLLMAIEAFVVGCRPIKDARSAQSAGELSSITDEGEGEPSPFVTEIAGSAKVDSSLETLMPTPTLTVPPTTLPTATLSIPTLPSPVQHTIQSGDTLLGLALSYNVPMAAIQLQNQLGDTTLLQVGQVLTIPSSSEWEANSPFWVVYLVEAGDTLSDIATAYELSLEALTTLNGIPDSNWLTVGQPLILPLDMPLEALAQVQDSDLPSVIPEPAGPSPTVAATALAPEPFETFEPTPLAPSPVIPVSGDVASWPAEVFTRINAVRAEHGLPPYTYNETLAQAAYLHGLDCQQRGYCNHVGSDGSTVKVRVMRAGYPAVGAAECIVYSASPEEAVAWWMDEVPPNDWHRRTLLNTWVTEIGVAVVPNSLGSYYFIADFGRP